VYSYRASYVESGALAVYAGTSPNRLDQALDLIVDELDRIASGEVTERELEVAKGHLQGSLALGLEDSGSRMTRIGRSALVHGEVLTIDELVARTASVTHDDLRRVAARVLGNERVLAVIGPFDEEAFATRVA
jgi:predicted Zn-dependent peptidase